MSEASEPVTRTASLSTAAKQSTSPVGASLTMPGTLALSVPTRRRLTRFGPMVPMLFIIVTIAVSSALDQPLRGGVDWAQLGLWTAVTALLLAPFAAALIVLLTSRRGGLVWTTTLVYTLVSGLLGAVVDCSVLTTANSTAAFGLISALVVQLVLLAPLSAAVAFVVHIFREARRGESGRR